jgi:hypothetical protein
MNMQIKQCHEIILFNVSLEPADYFYLGVAIFNFVVELHASGNLE